MLKYKAKRADSEIDLLVGGGGAVCTYVWLWLTHDSHINIFPFDPFPHTYMLGKFLGEMQGGVGRKGDIDEFGQKKLHY